MKKITDILSKEVVSVTEGEIIGIVTNGYTDERLTRVRGFKVSGEESDEARALPLRRILGEADALTVTGSSLLKPFSGRECPLGVKVFDSAGRALGLLRDLIFDEQDGSITSLSMGESEIDPFSVLHFGKNAIILRAPIHEGKVFRRNVSEAHPRTKKSKAEGEDVSSLPPSSQNVNQASGTVPSPEAAANENTPRQDYTFLLGRRVLRAIGSETAPIAQAGEIVTPEILAKARAFGKLVELTVNSKRG